MMIFQYVVFVTSIACSLSLIGKSCLVIYRKHAENVPLIHVGLLFCNSASLTFYLLLEHLTPLIIFSYIMFTISYMMLLSTALHFKRLSAKQRNEFITLQNA